MMRRLIWASVVLELVGLGVDALWHGLLHPEFEGSSRGEMARHLLGVHLRLYLGVLALLATTLTALVARARAGRVGLATPVMVAGAVAQTIGEAWYAYSHLALRPNPVPERLGFLGLAAVVVAWSSRVETGRRPRTDGGLGRGRVGESSPSAVRARARR